MTKFLHNLRYSDTHNVNPTCFVLRCYATKRSAETLQLTLSFAQGRSGRVPGAARAESREAVRRHRALPVRRRETRCVALVCFRRHQNGSAARKSRRCGNAAAKHEVAENAEKSCSGEEVLSSSDQARACALHIPRHRHT